MHKLENPGQKFKFTQDQKAISIANPFDGHLMPHDVPANYYKALYKESLLGNEISISRDQVLIVLEAYLAIGGWHVTAKMEGRDEIVKFMQETGNERYDKFPNSLVEIEEVN